MIGNLMTYTEPLKYRLTLLKPTYQEMSVLKEAYNIEYKGSLRDMNELSFSLPYYINEELNPNFSKVKNGYLIHVELYSEENDTVFLKEYFLIDRIENSANDKEVKNVNCLALEQQLSKKLLKNFKGVKKIYRTPVEIAAYTASELYPTKQDFINSGILNVITNLCPSWSVGEIDGDINELYRDILVDSESILSFLRNTVQTSFSCLFYFDSIKKEINVRNLTHLGVNRGFFISENNYIKSLKETIDDSDVVTKLNIFGKDELTIRSVNPTGETYILDLSYYRNTDYMSQSLLDALDHYDTLMESKSEEFQTLLTDLNTYTTQLNTKYSELTTLKGDLEALETQKDGLIAAGSDLEAINTQINMKKADIENVENEINSLQSNLDNTVQEIENLQTLILIDNNFTPQQIEELDYYIKEKTVRDNTFTDAQALYDEGIKVIKRLSQPSVQFDIDIVDLFDLVECQHDWHKVTLGDIGTIKFEKFNRDVELRLIAYTHNFENNKLSLTFGNRKNLNDPNMLIDDLKSSVSSAVSLDINKYKYLDYINSGDKTAIYQYINGLLDLATQGAVAGSNQEVKIDARGITLTNPSDPNKQVRLMHDRIVFTDDGWEKSTKVALSGTDGVIAQSVKGILGEFCTVRADQIVVGDAGEQLSDSLITNADTWNATSTIANDALNKANNSVQQNTEYNRVLINTTDGIKASHADGSYTQMQGDGFSRNIPIPQYNEIPTGVPNEENFNGKTKEQLKAEGWSLDDNYVSINNDVLSLYSTSSSHMFSYAGVRQYITKDNTEVSFSYKTNDDSDARYYFSIDQKDEGVLSRSTEYTTYSKIVAKKGWHIFQWHATYYGVWDDDAPNSISMDIDNIVFEQNPVNLEVANYILEGENYNYLTHIGTGSTGNLFCRGSEAVMDATVQLPDEFKGKNFEVVASLQDTGESSHGGHIKKIEVGIVDGSIDTQNARFKVKGVITREYRQAYMDYYDRLRYLEMTYYTGLDFIYFATY